MSNYPKAIQKLDKNQIQYKIIADTGHAINHERTECVNKEISQFILTVER